MNFQTIWILGVLVFLVPSLLFAEVPQPSQPASGPSVMNGPRPITGVPVMNENFFDNQPAAAGPSKGTSQSLSGNSRYLGEEPDYTTEDRKRRIEACDSQREISSKAFKDCYRAQERKDQIERRNQRDQVERKQGLKRDPLDRGVTQEGYQLGEYGEPVSNPPPGLDGEGSVRAPDSVTAPPLGGVRESESPPLKIDSGLELDLEEEVRKNR